MKQLDSDFFIPYYIFEEIVEYIELTSKGYCKCMKWENIKSLLNLAVLNNKLTRQEADFLKEKFCRENF